MGERRACYDALRTGIHHPINSVYIRTNLPYFSHNESSHRLDDSHDYGFGIMHFTTGMDVVAARTIVGVGHLGVFGMVNSCSTTYQYCSVCKYWTVIYAVIIDD